MNVILEIIVLFFLGYNTFVLKNFDTTYTLIALLVFLGLSFLLKKYKRYAKRNVVDAILVVVCLSVILLGTFYFIGFFNGYNINYNSMFKNYIEPFMWIKVFLIVGVSEVLRYLHIPDTENKHKIRVGIEYILILAIFVMVDVILCTDIYDLTKLEQLYEFTSLVLFQSISKNVLLFYLSKNFGMRTSYIYRFIMDLYIYFLPVTPKLNVFIEGVVMLAYPYLVYFILQNITLVKMGKTDNKIKIKKKENKIVGAIVTVLFVILVVLVSREFKYAMIAIGSESMAGSINKGDAVIYKTYDERLDELKKGDILVYYKGNMIVVHRIETIYSVYGENVYQTKGDNNENIDNWLVEEKDIIGVVEQRIPLIAWPSVKLNELFERLRGV